jgi:hypothetical protein
MNSVISTKFNRFALKFCRYKKSSVPERKGKILIGKIYEKI